MAAVASCEQPPPSILARVDRLDIMLGYLEELRSSRRAAARSPAASTTTSSGGGGGAVTFSDCGNSSVSSSPKSVVDRRRCRPIGDVVVETQIKGNLIDRVEQLEIRLLKLEEEMELEKKKDTDEEEKVTRNGEKRRRGKGLKRLVRSCVNGDLDTKE